MHTTSLSLLERVREPADEEAWNRFVALYSPLLFQWASRAGLSENDADDLVQDVFVALVKELPTFQYDGTKSFRAWLRKVLLNKWRDKLRRRRELTIGGDDPRFGELASADGEEAFNVISEEEYRQALIAQAFQLMRADFEPKTWQACWEFIVSEKSAAQVAAELKMTPKAVYMAKARVLQRLRQELDGLLPDE